MLAKKTEGTGCNFGSMSLFSHLSACYHICDINDGIAESMLWLNQKLPPPPQQNDHN